MHKFLLSLIFLVGCTASGLQATSYLYFQNNTSLPFSVSVQQSGGSLAANRWGSSATNIVAWQPETELLWTGRSTGITNNTDFYFDVRLVNAADTLTLKLKLRGTLTHSTLWQAASGTANLGGGFLDSWFSDRVFHTANFVWRGRNFTLKYKAKMTAGDDDIYYALQEANPFEPAAAELADSNIINILAYNIFMLTPPIAYTDQNERARALPAQLHNYDAIMFSEAFHNDARDNDLLPNLTPEYPYYTPMVDASGRPEDGGVFIASRWPIDTFAFIVYSDCDGNDCLAAKGAMYARINKLGKKYHLFATHTQAWNDVQNVNTRILQLQALKHFIDSLGIPANEPVLLGGDLNVDKIVNNQNEYFGMLDSFDAIEPTYLGHGLTYDADLNYYADTDREYLDYVLPLGAYQVPDSADNQPIILRSIVDEMWGYYDLSDHFALHGRFVYSRAAVPVATFLAAENSFLPYPNPARGAVFLPAESACEWLIFDALGRQQFRQEVAAAGVIELPLTAWHAGIYYIQQRGAWGVKTHILRLE
jgi:endonuclease/exonuclease/phosphatase family metal-dependent hydrolase